LLVRADSLTARAAPRYTTKTGKPTKVHLTRIEACESEAVRLVAEPGWRAVAYWARHSGGGWEIQGAWCWTREHRQPWPVEVRDLIALVGSGQAPQPPVVPAPPAPPVRRCAR